MEEFTDPGLLSDDELLELREELADELHWLCLRRWVLFDRIDLLRSEKVRRLRQSFAAGVDVVVAEPDYRSISRRSGDFSGCGAADTLALGARAVGRATPCPVARDRRDPGTTRRDEGCRERRFDAQTDRVGASAASRYRDPPARRGGRRVSVLCPARVSPFSDEPLLTRVWSREPDLRLLRLRADAVLMRGAYLVLVSPRSGRALRGGSARFALWSRLRRLVRVERPARHDPIPRSASS